MKDHKATYIHGLFVIFAVSTLFNTGCQYGGLVGVFGTPGYHEREVIAEYNLVEQLQENEEFTKKLLIIVDQPGWLEAQVNLRSYITSSIIRFFVANAEIPEENIIPYDDLVDLRAEREDFSLLSPAQIGKELDADFVLMVVVTDYDLALMHDTKYHMGDMATQNALYDVLLDEKVWPQTGSKKVKVGFEIETRGEDVANIRLSTAMAHCVTRYLYNCKKNKFRVSEDRTTIAWENW